MADRVGGVAGLVLAFHEAFGLTSSPVPSLDVPAELAALRLRLIDEEVGELHDAVARGDLVAIADALADITYVVYGAGLSYGIDVDAVVDEVHRANMSKLDEDGQAVRREDGKVLKSARYVPPDVARVLAEQREMFSLPGGARRGRTGGQAATGSTSRTQSAPSGRNPTRSR